MKRRSFLKSVAAAGAATMLPAGLAGSILSGCRPGTASGRSWNFDEVIDRAGTWSIKLRRAVDGKLAMWIADMDFRTAPAVHEALQRRLDRDIFGYTYMPDELIDAIVQWEHTQREWVGYAPGVIASICQTYLTFSEPGDKVIVQPPVYDPFKSFAQRLGRVVVDNPLIAKEDGRYEMDLEGMERLFDDRTKILILCNPHNPIGILWDRDTLARLAELCERHGVLVVSDEIHADLSLYGRHHIPFCSVNDTAARIGISFGSPTKSFNIPGITGTAYCIIPDPDKRKRFTDTLHNAKLGEPSIPTMVATLAAYTQGADWLDALKRYLEGNVELTMEAFDGTDGIRAVRPEASFLVWLDCRALQLAQPDLIALFNENAGVVINDGSGYGPGGEGFVRLNVGCPRSVLREAIERIRRAVNEQ